MRPRYSNFNQIVGGYLCSCPNLIPGKVMEQDYDSDEKASQRRTCFYHTIAKQNVTLKEKMARK